VGERARPQVWERNLPRKQPAVNSTPLQSHRKPRISAPAPALSAHISFPPPRQAQPLGHRAAFFFSSLLLSSLELSDTKVLSLKLRALLGTASHFCEVVVLKSRTVPNARLNLWDTVPHSLRADLLAVDDADLPALSTGELRSEKPAG